MRYTTEVVVVNDGMLNRKGIVAHHAVLHGDGSLDGVDFGVREDDVVVEHIRPGIRLRVVIGIRSVGQDIREGFVRLDVQAALGQSLTVCADFPDLQVGGAVLRMLRCRDELQIAAMVQVGHAVEPPDQAVGLFHFLRLGADQAQLQVDV